MIIDLVPPHFDKGWSFQIKSEKGAILNPEIRQTLLSVMNTPVARRAHPFLQGDHPEWLMVEFWTNDEKVIAEVASFFESSLK